MPARRATLDVHVFRHDVAASVLFYPAAFLFRHGKKYYEAAGSLKDAFGTQREKMEPSPMQGQKMISPEFDTVPLQVQLEIAKVFSRELESGVLAFESGNAEIKKDFFPFLDKLGKLAETMDLSIEVSGHNDNVPLKKESIPYDSNWGFSAARSVTVVEYWIKKMKIPPARLLVVAAAGGKPLAGNNTPEEAGWLAIDGWSSGSDQAGKSAGYRAWY
jgi:flagellar motor protein MotB